MNSCRRPEQGRPISTSSLSLHRTSVFALFCTAIGSWSRHRLRTLHYQLRRGFSLSLLCHPCNPLQPSPNLLRTTMPARCAWNPGGDLDGSDDCLELNRQPNSTVAPLQLLLFCSPSPAQFADFATSCRLAARVLLFRRESLLGRQTLVHCPRGGPTGGKERRGAGGIKPVQTAIRASRWISFSSERPPPPARPTSLAECEESMQGCRCCAALSRGPDAAGAWRVRNPSFDHLHAVPHIAAFPDPPALTCLSPSSPPRAVSSTSRRVNVRTCGWGRHQVGVAGS